jgi:hypothetical protein
VDPSPPETGTAGGEAGSELVGRGGEVPVASVPSGVDEDEDEDDRSCLGFTTVKYTGTTMTITTMASTRRAASRSRSRRRPAGLVGPPSGSSTVFVASAGGSPSSTAFPETPRAAVESASAESRTPADEGALESMKGACGKTSPSTGLGAGERLGASEALSAATAGGA